MEHTFFLKEPQRASVKNNLPTKKSLIIFSCYFKHESKQFKYSTGEKIDPSHWRFDENRPELKNTGNGKDVNSSTIKNQLDRYSATFLYAESECKRMNEEFTSKHLKLAFDDHFKKTSTKKDLFFVAYRDFMKEKQMKKEWKPATIKRYINIENHLINFQNKKKYKLTFNKINDKFYTEFTNYCYATLGHNTNTFARNVGLFKTFMYWAAEKKYTYNKEFVKFEKPERIITEQLALSLDQVQEIFDHPMPTKSLERVRDIFVFQCLTGLRYGELKLISERNIENDVLKLKEDKDLKKVLREIPLFTISKFILKKYNYRLPLIENQKQNEYVKKVVEEVGYIHIVEYTRTQNKEKTTIKKPFFKRISTHSARRTFITIMKNKGIADKTIMSMTGHTDLRTFNSYYHVDTTDRERAVRLAFGKMSLPKLKKV